MPNPRTPTYDQLSALCAQMAAALEALGACADRGGDADDWCEQWILAHNALTAYRKLSPDPAYAEAKNTLAALELAESVYRKNVVQPGEPSSVLNAMKAAINRARGEG